MSAWKVAAAAVGGLLVLGAANGGVVRGADGQVDPAASLSESFDRGGTQVGSAAGRGIDAAAEGVGRGAWSVVEETAESSAILSAPGDAVSAAADVAQVRIDPPAVVVGAVGGLWHAPEREGVRVRGNGGTGW